MYQKRNPKNVSAVGFTLGLISGTPVWILTGMFFDIAVDISLIDGVIIGIVIGSICALSLMKDLFEKREFLVIPYGMFVGALTGTFVGVFRAWSHGLGMFDGLSPGMISGIISGFLIAFLFWICVQER